MTEPLVGTNSQGSRRKLPSQRAPVESQGRAWARGFESTSSLAPFLLGFKTILSRDDDNGENILGDGLAMRVRVAQGTGLLSCRVSLHTH